MLAVVHCGIFTIPILLILALGSCAPVGPNYSTPDTPVPDFWNTGLQRGLNSSTPDIETWWRRFNDPTLNKLIALAETQNRDLAIAAERIEEARAQYGASRGALSPSLGASGGVTRNRSSESVTAFGPNPITLYDAGLNSSWETDFVGGLRRSVEAAGASLEATQEVYHDTMVLIYADVAANYITYRTLQRRISLAQDNLAAQKKSVQITKDRKEAGLAPQIDVSQAETNLATSQAFIPQLQDNLAATLSNLAVLVGRYPGSIEGMLSGSTKIPTPAKSLSIGLPADLLRSRPDIRAAERNLAAQTAAIGVAQAELYPKFSLNGSFTLQSTNSGDFVDRDSRAYSFGPSFRWRIFEGGRIRESIKIEESRARQALSSYENSVLKGVAEVESSLASIKYEERRKQHLDKSVSSSRETVSLIKDNYTEGLVDFQNVLDAERTVFDREDSAAASAGQLAVNHVSLYRSLGGGTKMPKQPVLNDKP